MASWSVDTSKAKGVQQEINNTASQINKLLQQYTATKQDLLKNWVGSLRDQFVQQTGNQFEERCTSLVSSLQKLSGQVGQVAAELERRDREASELAKQNP